MEDKLSSEQEEISQLKKDKADLENRLASLKNIVRLIPGQPSQGEAVKEELIKNYNNSTIEAMAEEYDSQPANEAQVQLEAWQKTFGTTQLTHALARLEKAESQPANGLVGFSEKEFNKIILKYGNTVRINSIDEALLEIPNNKIPLIFKDIQSKFGQSNLVPLDEEKIYQETLRMIQSGEIRHLQSDVKEDEEETARRFTNNIYSKFGQKPLPSVKQIEDFLEMNFCGVKPFLDEWDVKNIAQAIHDWLHGKMKNEN